MHLAGDVKKKKKLRGIVCEKKINEEDLYNELDSLLPLIPKGPTTIIKLKCDILLEHVLSALILLASRIPDVTVARQKRPRTRE